MTINKYLLLIILFLTAFTGYAQKLEMYLFGGRNCTHCKKIEDTIIKAARDKYPEVIYKKVSTDNESGFEQLLMFEKKYGDDRNEFVKLFFGYFPDKVICLAGEKEIEEKLLPELTKLDKFPATAEKHTQQQVNLATVLKDRAQNFTFWTVIIAGLLDGINPCVFSTLIFFMSLLAVSKIKGSRLLVIGIAYCLACFVTYLLLGFGLFNVLQSLNHFRHFRMVLNWTMIGVLWVFAFISLHDAWSFIRSNGDPDKVTLQLPHKIKLLIHSMMRKGLKFEYLFIGAFFIGMTVTLLESVCTGQVYIPTLTLLSKEAGVFSKWFSLLLLYNFMFILPLIGVFVLMFTGISVFKAVKLTKLNLIIGKIALAIFFLLLSTLLIFI